MSAPSVRGRKKVWDYDSEDSASEVEDLSIFNRLAGRGSSSVFRIPSRVTSASPNNSRSDNPQTSIAASRPLPDEWDLPEEVDLSEGDIMLALARQNYETFYKLKPGTVTAIILEHTSAGIAGWASCVLSESPTKHELGDNDKKRKHVTEAPPTPEPAAPYRKRGDEEEARELQLALLESIGVDVGIDAKLSLLHDVDYFGVGCNDESEDEGDWSIEYDEDDGLEPVSLLSNASGDDDRGDEAGLTPLAEGLRIASSASDEMASSYVVVQSNKDSSVTSTSDEEGGNCSETGLSPLTEALWISPEDTRQSSTESFVNVPAPPQDSDHSTSSSNDWALIYDD